MRRTIAAALQLAGCWKSCPEFGASGAMRLLSSSTSRTNVAPISGRQTSAASPQISPAQTSIQMPPRLCLEALTQLQLRNMTAALAGRAGSDRCCRFCSGTRRRAQHEHALVGSICAVATLQTILIRPYPVGRLVGQCATMPRESQVAPVFRTRTPTSSSERFGPATARLHQRQRPLWRSGPADEG